MIKNESVLINVMRVYDWNDRTGWEFAEKTADFRSWEEMESISKTRYNSRGRKFKLVGQVLVDKFDYERLVKKRRQLRSELLFMKGDLSNWKRHYRKGGQKVWNKERGDFVVPFTVSELGVRKLRELKIARAERLGLL